MISRFSHFLPILFVVLWQISPALADSNSNAAIRARQQDIADFHVTGDGVGIIQVDTEVSLNHPAFAGVTMALSDFTNEGLLTPSTEFFGYNAGTMMAPQHLVWVNDFHGTGVAGVMVGNGLDSNSVQTGHVGVSPGAKVTSGKMWTSQLDKNDPTWGTQAIMQLSKLIGPNDPYRVAILEDQSSAAANGSTLFALAADYAAWARDVTVVIPAGNASLAAGSGNFSIPADAFNGISVGATDATYTRVANFSNSGTTTDGRYKPDVLAPGVNISMPFGGWEDNDGRDASAAYAYNTNVGPANIANFKSPLTAEQDSDPDYQAADGTSFAGPHVAGQVALIQEYGRDHGLDIHSQTMRAVVVNSADKIAGVLGADETVTDKANNNWLNSPAYTTQNIPLDRDMGAGQVDVFRSLKQYAAGEHAPGEVPAIGWDYHTLGSEGDFYDYIFDRAIPSDGYVSASLAWRREITFTDANNNELFDPATDALAAKAADLLHMFLMPAASNDINDAIWSSISDIDNLQHIYRKVVDEGLYKLRVLFAEDKASAETHYGLAWWTVTVPEPSTLALVVWACACCGAVRRRGRSS